MGMQDFSLHVLDLVENSITAGAKQIEIDVQEDTAQDLLCFRITDNGRGMSEEMVRKVLDPFVTTRTTRRVGLGLSLFAQAAKSCNGDLTVDSTVGEGTRLVATFQLSHIDLKPWGSMVHTLITLIVGNPEIDFLYRHRKDNFEYTLDTAEIKSELGDVPISQPEVITLIKNDLKKNLNQIGID
jgi:anti-sigma regulatory factor (Ser/Thr protein kinase)